MNFEATCGCRMPYEHFLLNGVELMRVLILAGGSSAERSISLKSGQAVAGALRSVPGIDVIVRDPEFNGENVSEWISTDCDVIFPLVHGTGGEDGSLQRKLESLEIPFVGSSAAASELTFDKARCSDLLKEHEVCCPAEVLISNQTPQDEWPHAVQGLRKTDSHITQAIIKPVRQGSSVGMTVVNLPPADDVTPVVTEKLVIAIQNALQFDSACIVQEFICGRELTVGLLDGESLPVIEIASVDGLYDYRAKYESFETEYRFVDDSSAEKAARLAKLASRVCGTSGIVRVDFRMDLEGQVWFLEINTIPGMTERSLIPMAAAEAGYSLPDFCFKAIKSAGDLG